MTQNNPFGPEKPPEDKRYRYHNEKEEEKTEEKDEKGRSDHGMDEKWQRDPVNTATWAATFIWAGVVLLAGTTGWGYNTFPGWWNSWALVFTGAGIIILVAALFRMIMPVYRHHFAGGFVPGLIFTGVGLAWLNNWQFDIIWPVILIIIGLSLIFGGIFRHRR
jgi:hypothetical protein